MISKYILAFSGFLMFTGCISYCQNIRDRQGVYHLVEPGQTLWRIAKTYGVSLEEIARANKIDDVSCIKAGERVFIPGAIQVLYVEPFIQVIQDAFEPSGFIWPIRGRVISPFGMRNGSFHEGIDISSPFGTEIRAARGGEVIYSQYMRGFGNVVIIDHNDGFTTTYAHNLINLVSQKDRVTQGEIIGLVGSTGNATCPHLHFEIRREGVALDPCLYLPQISLNEREGLE